MVLGSILGLLPGAVLTAPADPPAAAVQSSTGASDAGASDEPKTLPQDGLISSIKQSLREGDQEIIRGHFDLGTAPNVHRYYCLMDPKTRRREPNGVLGDPIPRPDGMTGIKSSAVSLYRCEKAEQQGMLSTAGYVTPARAGASSSAASAADRAAAAVAAAAQSAPTTAATPAAPGAPASAVPAASMPSSAAGSEPLSRDKLLGAWRLVRIEYSDPHGTRPDPFYQAHSTGLLIYDGSGWMSVQIVGPGRRSFEVPGERPAPGERAKRSALKAAAFDSFYAYDGTWEFNALTSELVHHVVSSLLPAETGMSYTQRVTLEDGRLVFSNSSGQPGAQTVRRKIWERVPQPGGH